MIKNPASRLVAAVILVAGLTVAPLLDKSELTEFAPNSAPAIDRRPAESPRFQINWRQGELLLSGHTTSLKHEQDLLQVANSSYPGYPVLSDFRPLGIVPPYWEDTTVQVLYLLAETASAQALLSADEITIRGVTVDKFGWQL